MNATLLGGFHEQAVVSSGDALAMENVESKYCLPGHLGAL